MGQNLLGGCGEVDHHAMAAEAAHAGALVQLAVLVDGLELDAHAAPLKDCRGVVATAGGALAPWWGQTGWHVRAGRQTHVPTVMK